MDWQPIETAPKNEVVMIDLWAGGERHTDCGWGKPTYGKEKCWVSIGSGYDCNGPVDEKVYNVTHWMPLPEPPGHK